MYGWRARIGKISPSRSDTFTYEFYKIVPEGVVLVLSGFTIFNLVADDIEKAAGRIEASALDLARVGVDFIIAGGGVNLFSQQGPGSDREAIKSIEALTKTPATTSITADMEAFTHLALKKLAVATPFKEERNRPLKKFLEMSGFSVLGINGLGIQETANIAKVPSFEVYRLAKKTFFQAIGADGIFIPCSRWATIEMIDKLEQDLGVPVVTSTTAMIWKAFDRLNIKESIKGYGKLLAGG